eukprot:4479952-Prymnesium_polylepis.1
MTGPRVCVESGRVRALCMRSRAPGIELPLDETTATHAKSARARKDISAKAAWPALKLAPGYTCW